MREQVARPQGEALPHDAATREPSLKCEVSTWLLEVRPDFLKCEYLLAIFLEMLENGDGDSNDISYYTAGMLSFLLADGEDLWHQKGGCNDAPLPPVALAYSREAIGKHIISAIEKWNHNADFNIAYCPLAQLLSVLKCSDDLLASKYWAAWALNNLSLVEPAKYCSLLFLHCILELLDSAIVLYLLFRHTNYAICCCSSPIASDTT